MLQLMHSRSRSRRWGQPSSRVISIRNTEDPRTQAIFDLQVQSDLKADLQDLFITSAKEVEVSSNRKAIIIHVPFRLLKNFHRYI